MLVNSRPPALSDVAARAGVSHQTVSRVLNNHPHVAAPTRQRVQQAIDELRYRRNMSARVLATGQSHAIGVIALSSTLYGPSSMLRAVSSAATAKGMSVTVDYIAEYDETTIRSAFDRLAGHGVAGLLAVLPSSSAADLLADLARDLLPVIVVDGPVGNANVSVDHHAGGVLATRHLLEQGHSTVWHVAGPPEWDGSRAREEGWRTTLAQAGAEEPPLLRGDWSPDSGYRAGMLLSRIPECRAVFVANDHMALGLMRAFDERGRRIPEDVALVGFDDIPESGYFSPPLTTVRQDFAEVGRLSVDLLLRLRRDDAPPPPPLLVAPTLVARASSACPPTP